MELDTLTLWVVELNIIHYFICFWKNIFEFFESSFVTWDIHLFHMTRASVTCYDITVKVITTDVWLFDWFPASQRLWGLQLILEALEIEFPSSSKCLLILNMSMQEKNEHNNSPCYIYSFKFDHENSTKVTIFVKNCGIFLLHMMELMYWFQLNVHWLILKWSWTPLNILLFSSIHQQWG